MNSVPALVIHFEWKAFVRNKFQIGMLAVTFFFGLYAIYYGQTEINAQRETIQAVTALEDEEFSIYRAAFKEEMETLEQEQTHDIASRPAYAWYRHGYHAILPPHDFAALAIGQRDLFRFYYRLTGMSLHYQLFENELANPVHLRVGNFDLSFVVVYLFPLLIIAFCYGLYANEKENGTLPLLMMQPVSTRKILLVRLGFYFAIIAGMACVLSLIGLLTCGNLRLVSNWVAALWWIALVLTYAAFWFGLMFSIVSLKRNSASSAMVAVGFWLFFLILIPAMLTVAASTKYPLSSATLAGLTRRTSLENEDDEQEAREVIMEFLGHMPYLQGSDSLLDTELLPKAYAAFTSLKDINSQRQVDDYNDQVAKRNAWTRRFQWLSPAVVTQEALTNIVETDLETFLGFQRALAKFHGEITYFYFSRLFWHKPITLEDYAALPTFRLEERTTRWQGVRQGLLLLLVATAGTWIFGTINFNGS